MEWIIHKYAVVYLWMCGMYVHNVHMCIMCICAYEVRGYEDTRIRGYMAEITDRIELLIFANPRSYVTCQSVNPDWCAQC